MNIYSKPALIGFLPINENCSSNFSFFTGEF